MRFNITSRLSYYFGQRSEVLLLLQAAQSPDQRVHADSLTVSPQASVACLDDAATGERRAAFDAQGNVDILYTAEVEVLPRGGDIGAAERMPIRELPAEGLRYLHASRYCPSDRLEPFVKREFAGLSGGQTALAILDWISRRLEYRLGASTSATTALDTFLDGAGVCRDFTHLAITFFRAADIPARAVSVYAWQLDPPDMHAICEVYLGGRWWMLDATGKAPVDGLVRVATGLDAAEIAFMTVFGYAQLLEQSFHIEQIPSGVAAA